MPSPTTTTLPFTTCTAPMPVSRRLSHAPVSLITTWASTVPANAMQEGNVRCKVLCALVEPAMLD